MIIEYKYLDLKTKTLTFFAKLNCYNSCFVGCLMNKLGRKSSLILLTLLSIIGFSLTAADDLVVICIGRVISGFSVGSSVMVGKLKKSTLVISCEIIWLSLIQ